MKENWTYKKLGEVCEVLDSKRKPITKNNRESGYIPYYGATGIQDYVANYIFDGTYLLVGEDGAKWGYNESCAYIIEGKSWVNNHAHVLECKNIISKFYLKYYLNHKDLDSYITGAVVRKLTKAALLSIPIPVPPLAEQERIVEELDLLSGIIEKQKQQLKELDTLAQSIFYDTFGDPITNEKNWPVKKLGEVGTVKIGPFGSLLHKTDYITGGVPLVNPVHMKNGKIIPDNDFTISQRKKEELSAYLLQEGDVVFARRGDIGRCAIVTTKENGFLCGTGSLYVRFLSPIEKTYVLYWTKCESFVKELNSKAKGATMLNINCGIIEELYIPFPPLSLQEEFAEKIEMIEKQKEAIGKSIKETQLLFDYTMDKYFG